MKKQENESLHLYNNSLGGQTMTWFLDGKIQKQFPDFDINHLKQINEFHYFKEYNEYDDLTNCFARAHPI